MRPYSVVASLGLLLALSAVASAQAPDAQSSLAREILAELIGIDTTESSGNVTRAAEAMAKRLLAAGYPAADVDVVGDDPRRKNLVVRLRGTGKHRPVLLIGHLDVVEARREEWTTDPFELVEKDGYFYGRGTEDMKDGDAIMTAAMVRLKREGYRPARDIILALTADEEGGDANGVEWLLRKRRDLVDAELVLNHDGGSVITHEGRPLYYDLSATEKVYADFLLVTTSPGGHSSQPERENAIYELVDGLARLSRFDFPFELNNVTRAYYEQIAKTQTDERAAIARGLLATPPDPASLERLEEDSLDRASTRTTCVATRLEAGHANNALPQRAQATVNCRILPGHSAEEVRQTLVRVLADPGIQVRAIANNGTAITDTASDDKGYPPPPLLPVIMRPLERLVAEYWPGLPVIPSMSVGASDGVYTAAAGLPTYVVTGIALERDDSRAHGRNERIGVESFYRGNEFFYRYLKAVTAR